MDKETLSHYGWIVILVMILAVLLALATPFGTFIADGFKATYAGFDMVGNSVMDGVLDATGLSEKRPCGHKLNEPGNHEQADCGHYECQDDCGCVPAPCKVKGHYIGDGKEPHGVKPDKCRSHKYSCECYGPIVPEGAVYTAGLYTGYTGQVFYAGERLPCGYKHGDYSTLAIGDYIYRNCWGRTGWRLFINEEVTDRLQTHYDDILPTIFGEPLTYFENSFQNCPNLIELPEIPDTVFYYDNAFSNCSSLKKIRLPEVASGFYWTFSGCTSLEEVELPCTLKKRELYIPTQANKIYYHVTGCDKVQCCIHNGGEATCTEQAVCAECGVSYGELKPHTYVANTDANWEKSTTSYHQKAATCSGCGGSGFVTEAHKIVANNGAEFEYSDESKHKQEGHCSVCDEPSYFYSSHKFVEKENATWENYNDSQHKKEAICSDCGCDGYVYKYHNGGTATCQNKRICNDCNNEYGALAACSGGTATCKNKAVCSTCGKEYGEIGKHISHNGICSACGTECGIETEHSPYLNNQNNVLLGTWDYSDAKSVTITITYQTESTNYDWIYVKSGSNYLNANGQLSTSAYKFGGNTKTTLTFENVNMLTGEVIFRTDGSVNNYYGVQVIVTPNY